MLRRTYVDNDLIFVRATISTEYIESDPPIYRSYYPNDAACASASSASSSTSAGSGPSPTSSATSIACCARSTSTERRLAAPRAEPPDAGARLGVLPQQGRLRVRQDRQRPRGAAVRRARAPRRRRPARARRDPARPAADQHLLLALARVLHGRHGRAVRLRPVPARDDADAAALRAVHDARARQAGQDALLPRPAPAPPPLAGRVRRGARHPRPGDARLHAAVVPVRLQGDQGRVRPRQGHRPRDGALEVHDGQARRPRRADGRHARVHQPRAAARSLLAGAARAARTCSHRR